MSTIEQRLREQIAERVLREQIAKRVLKKRSNQRKPTSAPTSPQRATRSRTSPTTAGTQTRPTTGRGTNTSASRTATGKRAVTVGASGGVAADGNTPSHAHTAATEEPTDCQPTAATAPCPQDDTNTITSPTHATTDYNEIPMSASTARQRKALEAKQKAKRAGATILVPRAVKRRTRTNVPAPSPSLLPKQGRVLGRTADGVPILPLTASNVALLPTSSSVLRRANNKP
eukprot:m.203600 g.203600  ORF g.203600 m.203600 type:complete len:230 (+) comp22169_c0_seq1:271-960(+)